jgi:hypothetical protein
MLSDMRPQIQWGEDAERIVALATASADRLIRKLLIESITTWATKHFDRYDDYEVSFTVRLYAWMLEVTASNRGEMLMIHPQYDGPLPTREMLLGLADVGRTPRPDLTVKCGEASIHIEAKRVMLTKGLPAKYVNDGMMRFLDGRYVSPGVSLAFMLGYIMRDAPAKCYEAINSVIRVHSNLGSDQLARQREALGGLSIYVSEHKIGEITHYAIDVRDRQPSTLQSKGIVGEWDGEDRPL